MKHRSLRSNRVALLLSLLALGLMLVAPALVAAEETVSPETLDIANSLNCPVCQGLSVRDSNAQLAQDMRQTIQQRLDEGWTRQQIMDYFVDSYGVGILRNPPKSGFTQVLWWGPVIGLAAGVLVLGTWFVQRRGRTPAASGASATSGASDFADDDLRQYEERLQREIEQRDVRLS